MNQRKKLIEVALPLDKINEAAAKEKSIRHGHPSTLHLWWARRPLAAARAVIFSQMVDDPSAWPELFPTEREQVRERNRLFRLIEKLVLWENTTNEEVLELARAEIRRSWARECLGAVVSSRLSDKGIVEKIKKQEIPPLPAFHDPFAGGGSLPLEAQRLGLEAYASDLNPVAVLINKAMIEIPPKFAGRPPVNPESRKQKGLFVKEWRGAQGLAEDVRYYGKWMRDEAKKRIGQLYPDIEVTSEMAKDRPDLEPLVGQKLSVIAWIWARTVKSPNPAFANIDVPLASNFLLSMKPGKEAYIEPVIENSSFRFTVKMGNPKDIEVIKRGTKSGGSHSTFSCLLSGTPMPFEYLRGEARAGRMGARLMAIVAEGNRRRIYLTPTQEHEAIANSAKPKWKPDIEICHWPGRTNVVEYGMTNFGDLFTSRQLVSLITFSDLVAEARERVYTDALIGTTHRAMPCDSLFDTGGADARAYAKAVEMYLGIALSRLTDICNALCRWEVTKTQVRNLFGRQAIPMLWDFAENNVFGESAGDYTVSLGNMAKALDKMPAHGGGFVFQSDAQRQSISTDKLVSTDPPYYDNIGYASLSDFFYVWLRHSLRSVFPDLFATLAVPKDEELVATPYRHGSKEKAEVFFLDGMTQVMHRLAQQAHQAFPVTIYYAFKQTETVGVEGISSSGWETFLDAVMRAGFVVSGTWPMRTELSNRMIGAETNALASSIVLVCRKRATDAPTTTRREFIAALKSELPLALAHLQAGNIAPVDLAQAAIGPGMAVYTRYARVVDANGKSMTVREALQLINETLDEALAEQEGDFDADTRWALAWFEQLGFSEGEFGVANTLATAKNTSASGMVEAGFLASWGGKVRILRPAEMPADWDPATDTRLTVWEMVHHLIRVLESGGERAAAELAAKLGSQAEVARELAYRLYNLCERKRRAPEALAYNALVQSWPEIMRLAREVKVTTPVQQDFEFKE